MLFSGQNNSFRFVLAFILTAPLSAVTVNPALCPTNKIAPHRRIASYSEYQPRTFGAFYDLLAPGPGVPVNQQFGPSLLEEPQKDDLDDCGDIEDYDENDLGSLTSQYLRRDDYENGRLFFGLFNSHERPPYPPRPPPHAPRPPSYPQNPQYPQTPQYPQGPQYPQAPQRPQQPSRPQQTRPPYGSGGYFGNNHYRPPVQHYPSDNIKPVHDGVSEPQTTYRPYLVGGPIGHVVGVTSVPVRDPRPTRRTGTEQPTTETNMRYPTRPQSYPTRQTVPRGLNNDSILGSFIDLLFK